VTDVQAISKPALTFRLVLANSSNPLPRSLKLQLNIFAVGQFLLVKLSDTGMNMNVRKYLIIDAILSIVDA